MIIDNDIIINVDINFISIIIIIDVIIFSIAVMLSYVFYH